MKSSTDGGSVVGNGDTRVMPKVLGGTDGLEAVGGEPLDRPVPGQVRVRTLAADMLFTDVILREGQYPDLEWKPPLTLGYDIIVVIEEVGGGVTEWKVGDRVADLTMSGGYAHNRLIEAARITRVPCGVETAQAAAVVLDGMTAYQLLHRHANVKAGQRVLIRWAAGSFGQMLLELERIAGRKMYGTARATHAELVASLGGTPIDYQNEAFSKVVPEGFDVILDGFGEAGFDKAWGVVERGGFLSALCFQSGVQTNAAPMKIRWWIRRLFIRNAMPNGKRAGFCSTACMPQFAPPLAQRGPEQALRAGRFGSTLAECRAADPTRGCRRHASPTRSRRARWQAGRCPWSCAEIVT